MAGHFCKIPRILAAVSAVACLVLLISGAALLGIAEWKLRRTHDVPLAPLKTARGPVDYAEGERLAKIVGCWAGCHGMTGQGGAVDMKGYYNVTAPNLDFSIRQYSDSELVRLIRFGIKRDGTSALGMISYTFYPLSDEDLGNIIAHLRRQPLRPAVPRHRTITIAARVQLALAKWQVSADQIDAALPRWGELPRTTPFERGRYLASITCSECHGLDFRGNEFKDNTFDGGPSLAIVAMYGRNEFRHLMRTGEPIGGRDLGEMSWVARNGFVHFNDQEIDDIRAFLREYHGLPREFQSKGTEVIESSIKGGRR
jgi:cytochrome c553